jgi:diguanylate cyclase (GGDEF)-like protein
MRTDSLTGLRNRISFDELIDEACNSAVTAKRDSAVILLDLDGFKQINDVQGHDGGDLVLKHVAYWLSVELSQYGTAARFGGDEFAVIANSMQSRAELEAALERFLERTAEVGRLFDRPLGASIGVYYLDAGVATTSRFAFKAADQLMYRAKTLGKNQYVTSTNRAFSKIGELVEPSLPLPS